MKKLVIGSALILPTVFVLAAPAAAQSQQEPSDLERALNEHDVSIIRDAEGNAQGARTDGDVGIYVGGSAEQPTREMPEGDVTVEGGVIIEF